MNTLDPRKQQEIDHHNMAEELLLEHGEDLDKVLTNMKFYSIVRKSDEYADSLFASSKGLDVLDYCCGNGHHALRLAETFGANVTGIDLSDKRVESANREAAEKGLSETCRFFVMDAEHTTFADNSFDMIYCNGVLHHLDLDAAYKELARLLRPHGKIVAAEGLSHNPIIHTYRKLTPKLRTAWEMEHILSRGRIRQSKQYFDGLETRFFHLFTIAAAPFRKSPWLFNPVLTVMEWVDAVVLRIPGFRWWAWQCVFCMTKPKK